MAKTMYSADEVIDIVAGSDPGARRVASTQLTRYRLGWSNRNSRYPPLLIEGRHWDRIGLRTYVYYPAGVAAIKKLLGKQ